MRTALVWHELYVWHDTGTSALVAPPGLTVEPGQHAESPETKRRIRNLLDVSGLLKQLAVLEPQPASREQILTCHGEDYVAQIEALSQERGGEAGPNTPFGNGGYEIARLSAGGVITAVDAVMTGQVDNAYALVRPPGHHAERDLGRGFCIFCNSAIAVRHAIKEYGLNRVATIDWDVHHGNGTQDAFYDDDRVLTISLHQDRNFPKESGFISENGEGAGAGYNLNIPLPPGSGREAYLTAFERVVRPALARFEPELILVPSGFDGGCYDPLGRMMLYSDVYREMTRHLLEAAAATAQGRLVMCHEGGYSAATGPYMGLAVMETLSGVNSEVEDPFRAGAHGMGGHELQTHQAVVIDEVAGLVGNIAPPAAA